jgi:copper chaperone CopZ
MKRFFKKQPTHDMMLKCEDLHCEMCAQTVKEALRQVEGVVKVKVNVGKQTVAVSIHEETTINIDTLQNALKPTGYIVTAL